MLSRYINVCRYITNFITEKHFIFAVINTFSCFVYSSVSCRLSHIYTLDKIYIYLRWCFVNFLLLFHHKKKIFFLCFNGPKVKSTLQLTHTLSFSSIKQKKEREEFCYCNVIVVKRIYQSIWIARYFAFYVVTLFYVVCVGKWFLL